MSARIYELVRKLEAQIKSQREARLESYKSVQLANERLLTALTREKASLEAKLAKEAAKKLTERAKTLEDAMKGLKAAIVKKNKDLQAQRTVLLGLTNELSEVSRKCKTVAEAKLDFEQTTAKQKGLIQEVNGIITERIAKVKELLAKNLKDVKHLVDEAAKEPAVPAGTVAAAVTAAASAAPKRP
jgi:archaellum component FlaC